MVQANSRTAGSKAEEIGCGKRVEEEQNKQHALKPIAKEASRGLYHMQCRKVDCE